MNISTQNIDAVNAVVTVEILKADYEGKVADVLKQYRKTAAMPGFRQGKVPAGVIKKMYGKSVMLEEVNKLMSSEMTKFLQESEFDILGEPLPSEDHEAQDFETQEDFVFKFDVAISPVLDIKLSKREKLKYYDIAVDEDMTNRQKEAVCSRFGNYSNPEKAEDKDLLKGKLVELDADGNIKEGGIFVEEVVISSDIMKDADEAAKLLGAEKESTIVFNPKKAYAGNASELSAMLKVEKADAENIESDFQFTVAEITRYNKAEVNQELFDKVYGENEVKSEEEFNEKIKAEIKDNLSANSEYKFLIDAKDKLLKKIEDVVLPEAFLKRWLLISNENNAEVTPEKIEEDFDKILDDLRWQLIKTAIVKDNDIKVEKEDAVVYAKKVAKAQFAQYGMTNVPEEHLENYAQEMLKDQQQGQNIVERAIEDKLIAFIKEAVKIEDVEISLDEFNKLVSEN